jgi:hypothetical protein
MRPAALLKIDDAKEMTRIGIAAVDTVAEDRHISEVGIRHHEQFVHSAGKSSSTTSVS